MKMFLVNLAEKGILPDEVIRYGIRKRLAGMRSDLGKCGPAGPRSQKDRFVRALEDGSMAIEQDRVNSQHYELPPEFFSTFLGSRRKYSCCYWPEDVVDLDASEEAMLELTALRAEIHPGQKILDLGCGWGSFSLWAAERYPGSRFHALSNSSSQVGFIRREASRKGLGNLTVELADVVDHDTEDRYDRVVSIEMMEHMRNWGRLLGKIASWLSPGGKCFLHFFCHREVPYFFMDRNPSDWMGYYFFAGGMMPSYDLPHYFQEDLQVERSWALPGNHYARTLESWLSRIDSRHEEILDILGKVYGKECHVWKQRWRIFLMACSELFGTLQGEEWLVAHYLMAGKERQRGAG
ncbi:MAG TPA: cyclopropane-fatty-acyl-phospholipid synthase family protein [Synergistales bacterium]|nr:cyclopropane-fatty-acyl-phospholipid synthase family protein [Synergistales bacterium]